MNVIVLGNNVRAQADDSYSHTIAKLGNANIIQVDIRTQYALPRRINIVISLIGDLRHNGFSNTAYRPLFEQIIEANPDCRCVVLQRDIDNYLPSSKYFDGWLRILYKMLYGGPTEN